MFRLVLLLFAALMLNVVPVAASAHGLRMAAQAPHHGAHADHHGQMAGGMEAALCAWVCAGGAVAAPLVRPAESPRIARRAGWTIAALPMPRGLSPPRADRPPKPLPL